MATCNPSETAALAFPNPLKNAFPDYAVVQAHELEELSRSATGLDTIVQLLDADLLAQQANESVDDEQPADPVLSVLQRNGLLDAAAILVGAIHRIVEAHHPSSPHEKQAREAYTLALASGTLRPLRGA